MAVTWRSVFIRGVIIGDCTSSGPPFETSDVKFDSLHSSLPSFFILLLNSMIGDQSTVVPALRAPWRYKDNYFSMTRSNYSSTQYPKTHLKTRYIWRKVSLCLLLVCWSWLILACLRVAISKVAHCRKANAIMFLLLTVNTIQLTPDEIYQNCRLTYLQLVSSSIYRFRSLRNPIVVYVTSLLSWAVTCHCPVVEGLIAASGRAGKGELITMSPFQN